MSQVATAPQTSVPALDISVKDGTGSTSYSYLYNEADYFSLTDVVNTYIAQVRILFESLYSF